MLPMINLAGPEFDLANIVHSVLAECEHRRRGSGSDLPAAMKEAAAEKLATIRYAYAENEVASEYWSAVEREVAETALPQYIPLAVEQNRLESNGYDVWRGGDLAARLVFGLGGLVVGGIIVALPFIPIFEDAFAFGLAFCALLYPDLKKLLHDYAFTRKLNGIIKEAAVYQRRCATEYVTSSALDELFLPAAGERPQITAEHPQISEGDHHPVPR